MFDALDAAWDRACALNVDALNPQQQLAALERCEKQRRRIPAVEHRLINSLAHQAPSLELGGTVVHAIAETTLISRAKASRRIKEARDLGPRHGLTSEPIAPALAATAAAQRDGTLGAGQVAVIRNFCHRLPGWVDLATREQAEARLAREGSRFRPEQLAGLANALADCLNPDGTFTEEDRARQRGLTLGNQQDDGMSQLRGWLTPEARATLEAVLAKLAAPGMCNPDEERPCVDGSPTEQAIERDSRSTGQRNHDGLNAALRALLASGELGQHNGLPASIVVTTTLNELEAAAGRGLTGGATLLPMSDVIRLARHAHHYWPSSTKARRWRCITRSGSPRRGSELCCTPGNVAARTQAAPCPASCEVHHVTDYAACHTTDVDDLTFACGPRHRLLRPGGRMTRKNARGDTEWIPPPHLDTGKPRTNTFHHPEKLLRDGDEDEASPGSE